MGIGRRNFVKLTSAALLGITVDPLQAVVTNNDVYINRKLGVMFNRPFDWHFFNIADFGELTAPLHLAEAWEGQNDFIWENSGEPICITTKYDQNIELEKIRYSPSINLWINHESEFEELGFRTLECYADTMTVHRTDFLIDSEIVDKIGPFEISGIEFYEYEVTYNLDHDDLPKPYKINVKMLSAKHNSFYYDFDMHHCLEIGEDCTNTFEKFKSQIKLI